MAAPAHFRHPLSVSHHCHLSTRQQQNGSVIFFPFHDDVPAVIFFPFLIFTTTPPRRASSPSSSFRFLRYRSADLPHHPVILFPFSTTCGIPLFRQTSSSVIPLSVSSSPGGASRHPLSVSHPGAAKESGDIPSSSFRVSSLLSVRFGLIKSVALPSASFRFSNLFHFDIVLLRHFLPVSMLRSSCTSA